MTIQPNFNGTTGITPYTFSPQLNDPKQRVSLQGVEIFHQPPAYAVANLTLKDIRAKFEEGPPDGIIDRLAIRFWAWVGLYQTERPDPVIEHKVPRKQNSEDVLEPIILDELLSGWFRYKEGADFIKVGDPWINIEATISLKPKPGLSEYSYECVKHELKSNTGRYSCYLSTFPQHPEKFIERCNAGGPGENFQEPRKEVEQHQLMVAAYCPSKEHGGRTLTLPAPPSTSWTQCLNESLPQHDNNCIKAPWPYLDINLQLDFYEVKWNELKFNRTNLLIGSLTRFSNTGVHAIEEVLNYYYGAIALRCFGKSDARAITLFQCSSLNSSSANEQTNNLAPMMFLGMTVGGLALVGGILVISIAKRLSEQDSILEVTSSDSSDISDTDSDSSDSTPELNSEIEL